VIAFTGYKWRDSEDPKSGEIPLAEGAANSVKALSELGKYAAGKNVTLCLEQLNTRDHTHPMKGHPGYQGDNIDYVADIVKRVDSAHVKLLFDIYHVEMMNGDVIRRIRQYHDIIGHVHTAGNPGRNELDDHQEINYPAVMKALLEVGYKGYVGQEFIPTRDPLVGLTQAVSLCDVPSSVAIVDEKPEIDRRGLDSRAGNTFLSHRVRILCVSGSNRGAYAPYRLVVLAVCIPVRANSAPPCG
jgi:sugar phosphate isomerase/epimerase